MLCLYERICCLVLANLLTEAGQRYHTLLSGGTTNADDLLQGDGAGGLVELVAGVLIPRLVILAGLGGEYDWEGLAVDRARAPCDVTHNEGAVRWDNVLVVIGARLINFGGRLARGHADNEVLISPEHLTQVRITFLPARSFRICLSTGVVVKALATLSADVPGLDHPLGEKPNAGHRCWVVSGGFGFVANIDLLGGAASSEADCNQCDK